MDVAEGVQLSFVYIQSSRSSTRLLVRFDFCSTHRFDSVSQGLSDNPPDEALFPQHPQVEIVASNYPDAYTADEAKRLLQIQL
jgi:hypothetical protein